MMRETHIIGSKTQEWLVHNRICNALASNEIMLVGISDAAEGFRFVRPKWPHSQVMVCFGGEGRVWVQNEWRPLVRGQAYVTPPHTFSAYHAVPDHHWKLAWVTYQPRQSFSPVSFRSAAVLQADPRPLRYAIEGLYREMNAKAEQPCLQAWVDLIQLYAARIGDQDHHDRFWAIWEDVTADLAKPWMLEELAALADVSGEHFRRLCHRQLGRTPMQHLTYLRMHRAATLLVSTRSKVNAIADTVGYSNRFSFSNAFRREMGHTPVQYRKQFGLS